MMYEVKANLSRDHMRLLSEAGVRWIQPGLESLSDELLKLLNKGTSTLMNIQLLKWAREFGVYVTWNILQGIPGDSDQDYAGMAAMIPLLVHLQPPMGLALIEFERFSVYHSQQESFGLQLEPRKTYSSIYPLTPAQLARLAYYFEDTGRYAPGKDASEPGIVRLQRMQAEWVFLWINWRRYGDEHRVVLTMEETDEGLHIIDTRPCSLQRDITLTGLEALVYALCDKGPSIQGLLDTCCNHGYADISLARLQAIIADLQAKRLLLGLKNRAVSLATRKGDLPTTMTFPGGDLRIDDMIGRNSLNFGSTQENEPEDQTLESWLSLGDQ